MKVPLLDLKPQFASLKSDIMVAVERVCESQHFILGPAVRALEESIARYTQSARGIGVSSGTDALLLALMALDIGPADEVLTSAYTFFATGGTIARTGATPVFLDIDPRTLNLSPTSVRSYLAQHAERRGGALHDRRTGRKIRALMPVHLYGQMADMDAFMSIAQEFNLRVIEDAAQAIGSEDKKGRRAGSVGDIGCFSFFPTKNLGAFGDAGLCVTNDESLAKLMTVLRVHGGEPKYHHALIGGNFRIDELQAAVLNVKLPHLDLWTQQRQRNAAIYDAAFSAAGLSDRLRTPASLEGARHIYNQYVVRVERRDELRAFLSKRGVGSEIYYPIPLHLQKCFAYLGHVPGDLPEAERAAGETLALPIYPELSEEQLRFVVAQIAEFYS